MLWKKVMNNLSSDPIVWENFSPTILEFELPEKFTSLVNLAGDAVLGDESLSKKFDFSENLVGKVSKEIKIPTNDIGFNNNKIVPHLQTFIRSNHKFLNSQPVISVSSTIDNIHQRIR